MQTKVSEVASAEFASPGASKLNNLVRRIVIDLHQMGVKLHQTHLNLEGLNNKTNGIYYKLNDKINRVIAHIGGIAPAAPLTRKSRRTNKGTRKHRSRK